MTSEYRDEDVWRISPEGKPIQELSDSESGSDCEDQRLQETKFPDMDAFSSDDEAHPFRQPWAQGEETAGSQLEDVVQSTQPEIRASQAQAAEWASCNSEGCEGGSSSNYRSR